MKELEILIDDLKKHFAAKELELRENPKFNAFTEGFLLNRQRDIEGFQLACENHDTNPFLKPLVIDGFKTDAVKIKSDIDKITC